MLIYLLRSENYPHMHVKNIHRQKKLIKEKTQIYFRKELPKLNPYVAINALLTRIIPTEVTTLNIHAAASSAAFLSALLAGAILIYFFQLITGNFCPQLP